MIENDIQVEVNSLSKIQTIGAGEREYTSSSYRRKRGPYKAGHGKEVKRKMNKRNRKAAKQALKYV